MPADPREVLDRPAPPPDLVAAYGERPEQVADVWWPAADAGRGGAAGGATLVVLVHGGCWGPDFDRAHLRPAARALADSGYAVVAPEYRRLGAGGGWPDPFDDAALIADRLPSVVAAAGVPRGVGLAPRHVLAGHSAGGHLVLWAAGRHRLPASSPWRLAEPEASLAGVLALAPIGALPLAAQLDVCDGAVPDLLGVERGAGPDVLPSRWAQADPAVLLPTGVRTVLVHGADDDVVPVEVTHAYADAAREAGDVPDLRVLRGVEHFGLVDPLSDAWPDVVTALGDLLGPA